MWRPPVPEVQSHVMPRFLSKVFFWYQNLINYVMPPFAGFSLKLFLYHFINYVFCRLLSNFFLFPIPCSSSLQVQQCSKKPCSAITCSSNHKTTLFSFKAMSSPTSARLSPFRKSSHKKARSVETSGTGSAFFSLLSHVTYAWLCFFFSCIIYVGGDCLYDGRCVASWEAQGVLQWCHV